MWGDISLWNVQGPLLHSMDTLVQCILTVDYNFNLFGPKGSNIITPGGNWKLDNFCCGPSISNNIVYFEIYE